MKDNRGGMRRLFVPRKKKQPLERIFDPVAERGRDADNRKGEPKKIGLFFIPKIRWGGMNGGGELAEKRTPVSKIEKLDRQNGGSRIFEKELGYCFTWVNSRGERSGKPYEGRSISGPSHRGAGGELENRWGQTWATSVQAIEAEGDFEAWGMVRLKNPKPPP